MQNETQPIFFAGCVPVAATYSSANSHYFHIALLLDLALGKHSGPHFQATCHAQV